MVWKHSPGARRPGRPSACPLCGSSAQPVSEAIGVCLRCIRDRPREALPRAREAHRRVRQAFGLPASAPHTPGGIRCGLCAWDCTLGEGERGYCGLRTVQNGRLVHLAGTPERGLLHWYRDPLPTNCVADWVCEGHHRRGDHNLAVFYGSCTFNCLFCQNWHFRELSPQQNPLISARELAEVANPRTFCVCFFGGDPSSQMPHALAAGRLLARKGVRVCWETNGMMHPKLLDQAVQLSLETGGCIKFDLKAFDENLHIALTGASNRRTLENFRRAAARIPERPQLPLVVASTLLIPGYVDAEEVYRIARFIAAIDPDIPYTLLAFAPHFQMTDLPCTSSAHAREAVEAARAAGLTRIRIGNAFLLDLPVLF